MPEIYVSKQQHQTVSKSSSSEDGHHDIEAPPEFICPISLEVMADPVVSKNGQNYDRQAILQWLNAGNVNCPLTRQPLKPSLLVPNTSLKVKIMRWKMENGIKYDYVNSEPKKNDFIGYVDPKPMTLNNLYQSSTAALVASVVSSQQQSEPASSSIHNNNNSRTADDDLSDLLELYNEVLELTEQPIRRSNPTTSSASRQSTTTTTTTSSAPVEAEAPTTTGNNNNKKRWPTNIFSKKSSR